MKLIQYLSICILLISVSTSCKNEEPNQIEIDPDSVIVYDFEASIDDASIQAIINHSEFEKTKLITADQSESLVPPSRFYDFESRKLTIGKLHYLEVDFYAFKGYDDMNAVSGEVLMFKTRVDLKSKKIKIFNSESKVYLDFKSKKGQEYFTQRLQYGLTF